MTMKSPRYNVSCYDSEGDEIFSLKQRLYITAIDAFNRCVKQAYTGANKYFKVYLFDMEHPGTGMFVVAKYDADFH